MKFIFVQGCNGNNHAGAVAKKLEFKGSGEEQGGFWNKGISACAVCDGAAPMFRKAPLVVGFFFADFTTNLPAAKHENTSRFLTSCWS